MTALDVPVVLFQIAMPIGLLLLLIMKPGKSVFGFAVQALATGLGLLTIALTSIWSPPPWWVPAAYGLIWFVAVSFHSIKSANRFSARIPQNPRSWLLAAGYIALGIYGGMLSTSAIAGRFAPESGTIDLPLPLGPGTYLVANGGSTQSSNAHLMTLSPTTERQRDYRGQSFAVDLVKIGKSGNRASGWRPRDPEAYKIFGEPVFAPCDGTVASAADDMPDMPVPEPNRSRLEGNYVFLDCSGYGVLMAHFQSGSLLVTKDDRVYAGQPVARVGNSGQTFEPHLHIHAQELVSDGFYLSGEPLHITFNGRFPARNMRITVPTE